MNEYGKPEITLRTPEQSETEARMSGQLGALACDLANSIHFGYFNYQDGGYLGTTKQPDGTKSYNYDFQGLIDVVGTAGKIVGHHGPWPDVLVMGEGNYYGLNDEAGAKDAAKALREASDRHYTPLVGSLPRDWGPFAPVVFVDTETVHIQKWHHHLDPEFATRNRNRLLASFRNTDEAFNLVALHGDVYDGDMRLADARPLKRYTNLAQPCLVVADWNSVPSGPMWEPLDLNDPAKYPRPNRSGRVLWKHGPEQGGPFDPDTRALDFLLGYWQPNGPIANEATATDDASDWGHRIGNPGFFDAAELARDATPTQYHHPDSRQRAQLLTYDRILVNEHWKDRLAYGVRPPLDSHPSDHLMVDVLVYPAA